MRRTKPAHMKPREQLDLFALRAKELMSTRLGREGFACSLNIHFDKVQGLTVNLVQPDEEVFRSFLLSFRQFISPSEPVFMPTIYNVCFKHISDAETVEKLVDSRRCWRRAVKGRGVVLIIDGKAITPEIAADIWINGHYFHNTLEQRYTLSNQSPLDFPIVRAWFVNYVIDATREIDYVGQGIRHALSEGLVTE